MSCDVIGNRKVVRPFDADSIVNVARVKRLLRNVALPDIAVQLVGSAAAAAVVVVVVIVVGRMVVVVVSGQSFGSAQIDDFVVLCLEVQSQVTSFTSEPTQSTLQGSAEMLDFLSVVNRQQVSTHFRILRLRASLATTPTKLRRRLLSGHRISVQVCRQRFLAVRIFKRRLSRSI